MPTEQNAVVDPTGSAMVVWLVLLVPALAVTTLTCVRLVGRDELLLVVRRGRVVRSRRSGLIGRWPGVERFEEVPAGRRVLPLVIRSRTRDGVDIVALADLVLQVHTVDPGTRFLPTEQSVRIAETTVGAAIAELDVRSLLDGVEAWTRHWVAEVNRLLPEGTEATELAVTELEAQLTPRVADALGDDASTGGAGDGGS